MKLSLWNIYNLLSFPHMEPKIENGGATIQYVRFGTDKNYRSNTVYVSPGKDLPGGHDVVIIHRKDSICVDGEEIFEVFNRVASVVDRFAFWEKRLLDAEHEEDGVQIMLDGAQSFLSGAFYALTFGGKTLGLSCSNISSLRPIWDEIAATQDLSYERLYALDKYIDFTGFVPHAGLTTERSKDGSFYYSYQSMDLEGQNIGFLAYCGVDPAPPKGTEVIMNALSRHVTQYFLYHLGKINLVSRASDMLQKLLKGDPAEEVRSFFRELHWERSDEYQLMAIDCAHQGQSSEIIRACRGLFRLPLFCGIGKALIMLVDLSREPEYETAFPSFRQLLTEGCVCGISNLFHNLYGASLYCEQALEELKRAKTLSVSWSMAEQNDGEYFRDVLLSRTMSRAYINRKILKLLVYDFQNGTEYYPTIRAYILTNFHVTDAARIINIHRNTFLYRLERIRGIIDFTEFDETVRTDNTENVYRYVFSLFVLDELIPTLKIVE